MDAATIAVIDDDRSFVDAVALFLEEHGYRTCKAFGGQEGLQVLQSKHVDAAIIDVHMADLDGLRLCRRVIELGHHVPTVMISSDDSPEMTSWSREAGACEFLAKPISPDSLLQVLRRILNGCD